MLAGAAAAGALLWAVPLVVVTGGLSRYLESLTWQGTQDFAAIEMLATNPTWRLLRASLSRTFVGPWQAAALANVVLLLAVVGTVRLVGSGRRILAAISLVFWPVSRVSPDVSRDGDTALRAAARRAGGGAGGDRPLARRHAPGRDWRHRGGGVEPDRRPAAAPRVCERRRAGVSRLSGHAGRAAGDDASARCPHAPSSVLGHPARRRVVPAVLGHRSPAASRLARVAERRQPLRGRRRSAGVVSERRQAQ